jgi:hypothetical protein
MGQVHGPLIYAGVHAVLLVLDPPLARQLCRCQEIHTRFSVGAATLRSNHRSYPHLPRFPSPPPLASTPPPPPPPAGKFVVVLDDEDRENEGDLIINADKVTSEAMAFMVEHTSGVVSFVHRLCEGGGRGGGPVGAWQRAGGASRVDQQGVSGKETLIPCHKRGYGIHGGAHQRHGGLTVGTVGAVGRGLWGGW